MPGLYKNRQLLNAWQLNLWLERASLRTRRVVLPLSVIVMVPSDCLFFCIKLLYYRVVFIDTKFTADNELTQCLIFYKMIRCKRLGTCQGGLASFTI